MGLKLKSKGIKKILAVLGVLFLVSGLSIGGFLFINRDDDLKPEEITQNIDEGTCSEKQADALLVNSYDIEDFQKKGEELERALNCYVQLQDWESSRDVAELAQEAYGEAGLAIKSEQMRAAKETHQFTLDFETGVYDDGTEPVEAQGDVN